MAQPTPYTRQSSFAAEESTAVGGRSTVRTAALDAELDAAALTISETLTNLALIQRDDGELRDATVKTHTLGIDVRALLGAGQGLPRGAWVTATAYALRDMVTQSGNTYICSAAHTSGTFATDLAAVRWLLLTLGSGPSASAVPVTPVGSLAATNVQAALAELDSDLTAGVAEINASIADATVAAKGAGQVGFGYSLGYGAGTIGKWLKDLALSTGASFIGWIQAGTGSVLRTIQAKLRDELNVKDYGAVADGTFVAGGSASGTDNLAAFNATLAAAVSLGISRVKASGVFRLSGKLPLPRGITLQGDGTAHLPVFLSGSNIRGTVLLIAGAVGDDCLAFEPNAGHSGLKDIAVFNTNTNAIRSVISVVGQLYPRMKNVEFGSLRRTTGVGLYLAPSMTGAAYETLWGQFDNLICSVTGVGTGTEASVRWGLYCYSLGTSNRPNANQFLGGNLAGTWGAALIDGSVSNSGPLSVSFHGVNFDVVWDGTFTPQYQAAAANVFGFTKANCYIYPCVQIKKGFNLSFHGCYFESAGAPGTFNDGTNGSATLVAVGWVDSAAECVGTGFYDCSWNGAYLFDKGTRTACTPTADGHRHDTRFAAKLSVRTGSVQAVPHNTWTKVGTATVLDGDDNELEWDATNVRAAIRSAGTYMVSGQVEFAGWATSSTYATCRVTGGGVTYVGNTVLQQGAGVPIAPQVTAMLTLAQGDTLTFEVFHNQGGSQNTSGANAYMNIVKIA